IRRFRLRRCLPIYRLWILGLETALLVAGLAILAGLACGGLLLLPIDLGKGAIDRGASRLLRLRLAAGIGLRRRAVRASRWRQGLGCGACRSGFVSHGSPV